MGLINDVYWVVQTCNVHNGVFLVLEVGVWLVDVREVEIAVTLQYACCDIML